MPVSTRQQLERAGQWLLHSGIQDTQGGVARFYRSDLQRNHNISTEITGYQASALVFLHHVTKSPEYLERAIETARFLAGHAWDAKLQVFPFEIPGDFPAYFFDSGIIVRGLLAVWRETRDEELLSTAVACGKGMLNAFDAGPDFHPVIELPSKVPALRDARWSRSSGCYQLKAALGWLELAEESGEASFRDAWDRLLKQSIATHASFLPGHADPAKVMDRLHAYSYFLEALLPVLPQPALAEGIDRVAQLLHSSLRSFVRSDVYAQLLRLRLYADAAGALALDRRRAALEAEALGAFQAVSDDPRVDGGFYFGSNEKGFLPYVNPVSTAFAMQALEMWRAHSAAAPLPGRRLLI